MDGADVPVSDAPNPNDSKSTSFSARVRQRLKKIGAIIASVGAIGAVVGGLAGYWRTWDIVYSHVGGDHTKIAEPTALIFSNGPSVAVLPISNPVKSMALDPIADAMTQQLVSSLGRFSLLRVIPRTTTANFLKQGDPIEKPRGAGVDYLVTGEVRPLREGVRANIQIADLRSGLEVWSKSFDATAEGVQTGTDAYEIGDIAAAQINSAIETGEYKKIQNKPVAELKSYECIIQARVGGLIGSHATGLRALECSKRLIEKDPNNAYSWAVRSGVLVSQRLFGFGLGPDQVQHVDKRLYLNEEIVRAATRAVELAPDEAGVRRTYAQAMATMCQVDLYRQEVQKAVALNPNDPFTLGSLGVPLAYMGDWDDGAALAEKAIRLAGPNASYVWWLGPATRHWWRGEYQQALEDFRYAYAYVDGLGISEFGQAYTLPFLGRIDEAKALVAKLLKRRPDFTIREADAIHRMYCLSPEYIDRMNGALRQAGLPD